MNLHTALVTAAVTIVMSCSSSSDDHGHVVADAASDEADATPADSESLADGSDASSDTTRSPDAAASCSPACDAAEVCCLDVHGHFPTCRPGPACP